MLTGFFALWLTFGAITSFVFANSFEVLFSYDIPYIDAVNTFQSKKVLESVVDTKESSFLTYSNDKIGNFGSPTVLKFPQFSEKIRLVRAVYARDKWLYRTTSAHYFILSESKNGNIGNLVIYTHKNWRTLLTPHELNIGDNIFIDTDSEWRYMYRITDRSILRPDNTFVPSESPVNRLVLVVEDSQKGVTYVFQANFVSLQNAQQ